MRAITKIGDRSLRTKCRALRSAELKSRSMGAFRARMIRAMRRASGVGLAANQVGRSIRLAVLECRANPRYPGRKPFALEVLINPRIVRASKRIQCGWEGCLSIPGYRGLVPRAAEVTVEARTPEGARIRRTYKGFHARVLQHEVDHLDGLFYLDRLRRPRDWLHLDVYNKKFRSRISDGSGSVYNIKDH